VYKVVLFIEKLWYTAVNAPTPLTRFSTKGTG
jgi:hypothetical protein